MKKILHIFFLFIAILLSSPMQVSAGGLGNFALEELSEDVFDFSLSIDDDQVEILWKNTPEEATSFMIERSFDGKRYSRIYQSSFLKETDFLDDLSYVNADVVYYRFTFFLNDGEEMVSTSKLISLSSQNHLKAEVLVNGGQVDFNFFSSAIDYTTIQIFNSVGNLVGEDEIRAVRGDNAHSITLYGMRSGMYFLHLQQGGKVSTTKFFLR